MAAEVPRDLIYKILRLLPVKTLLRFRCISKSLCSFLDSPKNSDHRTIITFQEHDLDFDIVNPNYIPINVLHIDIDDDLLIPQEFHEGNPNIDSGTHHNPSYSKKVYAHCNGLVLIAEEKGCFNLIVWNPFTRKCMKLPLLLKKVRGMNPNPLIVGLGFWYDSSEDDYKIIQLREWRNHYYDRYYKIWILGLRSGYWRKIKDFPYENSYYLGVEDSCNNLIADGAFHFKCDGSIYALDLAKETFATIPFPDDVDHKYDNSLLQVLEGCLCVRFFRNEWNPRFNFFARKKNDAGEFSWINLFSIINDSYDQNVPSDFYIFQTGKILGFSKDRVKIYVLHYKYELYSYDFKEKKVERIIVAENKYNQRALFCIKSLVWMDMKEEEKNKKKKNKKSIMEINGGIGVLIDNRHKNFYASVEDSGCAIE